MKLIGIFVIRLYQLCIGPFVSGACRFYPSCSEYAAQALQKYGLLRGVWLACKRILKCHPWHPGGPDEVP